MFVAVGGGMGSLLKGREGEARGVCVCVKEGEKGKVKTSRRVWRVPASSSHLQQHHRSVAAVV